MDAGRLSEILHRAECGCGDGPDFTHEDMAGRMLADEQFQIMLMRVWDEGHNHCFHVEDPKNDSNPCRGEAARLAAERLRSIV